MTDVQAGPLTRHNATVTGKGGTTLVFAHGYGCDQTVWREVSPAFEDHYRVVTFDHAGAGHCDRHAYDNFRHSSLAGYADDVIAVCDALQSDRLIVVGHSVSAMIGALAAIKRPELFDLMVMIGPTASYINDGSYVGGFDLPDLREFLELIETNFEGWGTALAMLAMGNHDRPALAAALRDRICRVDPAIAGIFARATFLTDLRGELPSLTTPTVILHGAEDPVAPQTAIDFVHDSLPGSQVMLLDATGHCPHLSHPAAVIAALREVLAQDGRRN